MLANSLTPCGGCDSDYRLRPMTTFEELNALSSKELHDRATSRAKKHFDIGFFWEIAKILPAAESAIGNEDQASADIFKIGSLFRDFFEAEDGDDHLEALRPFFIEYLEEHNA
jgi:hypothetical protein